MSFIRLGNISLQTVKATPCFTLCKTCFEIFCISCLLTGHSCLKSHGPDKYCALASLHPFFGPVSPSSDSGEEPTRASFKMKVLSCVFYVKDMAITPSKAFMSPPFCFLFPVKSVFAETFFGVNGNHSL